MFYQQHATMRNGRNTIGTVVAPDAARVYKAGQRQTLKNVVSNDKALYFIVCL